MAKDKAPEELIAALASPVTTETASSPASYQLVGLDPEAQTVYFPETSRSYVLAEMTACQLEQLHRSGSKHVDKVQA